MDRIDAKLIQAAVLLDRQYLITEHLVETIGGTLAAFQRAIEERQQELSHVLAVYNYVFALIDHLVRYEKIAFSIPRLNQKSAEYRAFREAMGNLKEIRNQLQHINNDIENENSGPLLGTVCWVSNNNQYIASFHDIGRKRSSPGIVMDTQTGSYLHEFCYVYNDIYYDLGGAIAGMRTFNDFISAKIRIEIDGKPYETKDHFLALCVKFQQA